MDPRRLLPALAGVAALCVLVTVLVTLWRGGPAPAQESSPLKPVASGPAVILAEWDARRAAAWAEGDVGALHDLYADGSRAGAADVRLLRRYVDRGLRVTGLTTQVLALSVLSRDDRLLRLVVTDRLAGGRASGGGTTTRLPADRASTRRIDLVRVDQVWLVDEVRDQASAAASTSRTSSSSKS